MEYRGFRAKWHLELYDIIGKKWEQGSVYVIGTWEEAVTACSKRRKGSVTKFRVSPVAVLLDD